MPYCYYMDFSEFIMVSPKCYKAICFDGEEYFLPTSQCYWLERNGSFVTVLVSEWILEKKGIKPQGERIFSKIDFPLNEHDAEEVIVHNPVKLKPEEGVMADESLKR